LSQHPPTQSPATVVHPSEDSGLIGLMFVLRRNGAEIDLEQLRRRFGPPVGSFGVAEMLAAAEALGYETRQSSCFWEQLAAVPFPALALLHDGRFLVLGAVAEDRVLLQDPHGVTRASVLAREDFLARWSGRMVLVTTPGVAS
jgi:subfamily B ATP-binding cassette protein HlyB/CyaB